MKPVERINKKFIKDRSIKDKYWASSLYAIEEEYVPTSLVQNLPEIIEEDPQNNNEEGQN